MSDKIIQKVSDEVVIESSNLKVLPYGVVPSAFVTKEEWVNAVLSVQKAHTMSQWFLGDLFVIADEQWKGEMYDIMENMTGMERQHLQNLTSVCRAFSPDIRETVYSEVAKHMLSGTHTKLSFSHFRYAAPLMNKNPEHAVDFLIRAGQQGWSVNTLIEQILRWKNGGTLPEKEESGKSLPEWVMEYKAAIEVLQNEDADFVEIRGMRGNEVVYTAKIGIPRLEE